MANTLVVGSLWSGFTQAYERREMEWIHRSLWRLRQLMLALGCAVLALLSPWLIGHWLSPEQVGPPLFYGLFATVTVLSCWLKHLCLFPQRNRQHERAAGFCRRGQPPQHPGDLFLHRHGGLRSGRELMGNLVSLSFFSILGQLQVLSLLNRELRNPRGFALSPSLG